MDYKQLAKLVKRAQKGETQAFAELYSYFAQPVYYLALRILRNEQDANDIVQETILKLYNNLNNLKNPRAATSFVNKTAYNCCVSFLRSKKNDLFEDEPDLENITLVEEDFVPEQYLEQKEKRDYVIGLIDGLNYQQRTVMLLYYFDDLSIKEISEILETTEKAVKNRLFRAKENLKSKLKLTDMKGVIMASASVTVLSKILTLDANASFSPTAHAQNWSTVASKMGLPVGEISQATVTATQMSSVLTPASAVSTGVATLGATLLTKTNLVIATIVAGTVVAGTGYFTSTASSKNSYSGSNEIPVNITSEVFKEDINSQPNTTIRDDIYISEETIPPIVSSENQVESAEDGANISQPALNIPTIQSANHVPLRYKTGTTLTREMIVNDAKITVSDGAEIVFNYFEEIDVYNPDQYGVYIRAKNEAGVYSDKISIIVIIEK